MEGGNLIMLPRDAPTDVLNEIQLVKDFYGADTPTDHQRVMALFAPNANLDLPQMCVSGRESISAVMFYAKSFIADVDIEPYMVEVGSAAAGEGHHATETTTLMPESSTTSTDSTSSTCTSAATSKRRRASSGKPPKAPSAGTSGAAAGPSSVKQQPSRLGRKQHSQQISSDITQPRTRSRQQHSDLTDQGLGLDGTAQNGRQQQQQQQQQIPRAMSRTHVYAVATITPKALARLITLNLLPREFHLRTKITLVWDDEAGEVLLLQERPDNLPVGLVPGALKRFVGGTLAYVSTRSQWLIGKLARTGMVANRWPGLQQLHGTGL